MTSALPFHGVAILGVGLLGGSIGLALRRAGYGGRIVGFGHRQGSLDAAVAAGAVDAGHLDLAAAVAHADLVVLATPVGLFEPLLAGLAGAVRPDAVVTDVGSTKRRVVAWARRLLPKRVRFVGSHPIAGSDQRGVQYARADLFDGACCVLTPLPRSCDTPRPLGKGPAFRRGVRASANTPSATYASAVDSVDAFWQSLGMWTVRMSPAAHDRCLAEVSHLPHASAAALMLLSSPPAQDLAGNGFLDTTRIAGGDPQLWRDIFLTNAREVARAIKALNRKLDRLATLISRRNGPGLVRFLAEAQTRRQALMARRLNRRQVEG